MPTLLLPYYGGLSPLYVNDPSTLLDRCDVRAVAELVYDWFVDHRRWRAKRFRLGHLVAAVERVYVQSEEEQAWSADYAETYLGCAAATRKEIAAVCLESLLRTGWVETTIGTVPVLEIAANGTLRFRGVFYAHDDLIEIMRARDVG